jgi:hypothetical protein
MVVKTVDTWLPEFPGFYETGLDMTNDPDIEYTLFTDPSEEEPDKVEYFTKNVWDFIDYETLHDEICRHSCQFIADAIASALNTHTTIDFQQLRSPKEYNFTTDSVNCAITLDVEPVYEYLNSHLEAYTGYVKENYTSRSGFISSYDTSMELWLDPANVEQAHEFGAVLAFILQSEYPDNELYGDLLVYISECVFLGNYIDMDGLTNAYTESLED